MGAPDAGALAPAVRGRDALLNNEATIFIEIAAISVGIGVFIHGGKRRRPVYMIAGVGLGILPFLFDSGWIVDLLIVLWLFLENGYVFWCDEKAFRKKRTFGGGV